MSREPPLKPTVEKQAMPVMSLEPPLKPTVEKQATLVNVHKPTTKKVTIEKPKPMTERTTIGRPKPQTKKSTIEKPHPITEKTTIGRPKPQTKKSTIEKPKPITERTTIGRPKPQTKKSTIEKPKPITDRTTIGRPKPTTKKVTKEKPKPITDRATIGRPKPQTKKSTIEKPKPITERTTIGRPKPQTKKSTIEKPKPITDRTTIGRPKPQTKKSTIEKPRPQTPKKSLRIGDFQLYPKWDIEEDYHRDPSAKKTTCPESIRSRSAEIDWFKQLFIPDISLFMHKEHFNDEEWKRLEHFNPPYGWMGTNYTEVKQAVELIPGLKEQTVLLSPKRNDGCIRCAAVGNGGILNGSRKGAEIDSHDYVFRVNGAVIKGFEDDVGVRTSFYVHTAQTMLSSLWGYQELGFTNVPMDKEIKYIMVTEDMRDYQWLRALLLNTMVSRGPYLEMRPRSYFGTDFTPEKYLVAHPDFNRYIKNRFLKSKTVEGIDWAIYRPTTGAFALLLALHLCDVVDAYGYITEDYAKYPDHYYDKTKTKTVFYGNHDFGLEIKEWKKLHDAKIMNLYHGR
ncbi:alpha-N-acetylgalactosaminide alpha-2,6-sialyltransferase 2-like [Acipenser ruthenus]|uniref:alpha-N-acetylgalactosaminide alpha-2,6-sialyltransferase 2-like n=1 Tax=Acipenser ruthenus TaxID=7906 RepID=UPI002740871A|nr:alpha-N-acetylgalactosaminide alpha-2,6-sialyltransferase 2-like [Acipenser ruthenus]